MKNPIFIFCLCTFCFCLKAYSQDPTKNKSAIRGGFILGVTACQVDGDDYAGYHKVGLTGGFVGQIILSKKFFVSTEILYSQKGAKSATYMGQPLAFKWNLSYAEIPLLIHFQEKKAFNFGIGASFGRLVSQYQEVYQIAQPKASFCSGKVDRAAIENTNYVCLRKNEYAAIADMSYLVSQHFSLNVRFSYSMAPMGYYGQSNFISRGMFSNDLFFRAMYVF